MSQTSYSFDAAAALLHTGRNTLIRALRERGLLGPDNLPVGAERGGPHFRIRSSAFLHPVTGWTQYARTEITPQGLNHIARLLGMSSDQRPAPAAQPTTERAARGAPPQREKRPMNQAAPTKPAQLPLGTLHDAGEFTVVTRDGERVHHRAALVVVFENPTELQQAINAHRCAYQIRRDIPEEQLHPAITQPG